MCFATVMVHVDIDGKSNGRIHVAVKLADWFSSDLIGISAALLPPYPAESGYFVTLEAIEREQRDVKAALARAEASFRNIAGADQKGLEWRSDIELPEFYVVSGARAADLLGGFDRRRRLWAQPPRRMGVWRRHTGPAYIEPGVLPALALSLPAPNWTARTARDAATFGTVPGYGMA